MKKNLRIVYVIIACVILSVTGIYATVKQIELKGKLKQDGPRSPVSVDSFVLATVDDGTYMLDLEFLKSADDVTIEIWDDDEICIFSKTTNVSRNSHIRVDLSVSDAWSFEIYIYNEDMFITGVFEL